MRPATAGAHASPEGPVNGEGDAVEGDVAAKEESQEMDGTEDLPGKTSEEPGDGASLCQLVFDVNRAIHSRDAAGRK